MRIFFGTLERFMREQIQLWYGWTAGWNCSTKLQREERIKSKKGRKLIFCGLGILGGRRRPNCSVVARVGRQTGGLQLKRFHNQPDIILILHLCVKLLIWALFLSTQKFGFALKSPFLSGSTLNSALLGSFWRSLGPTKPTLLFFVIIPFPSCLLLILRFQTWDLSKNLNDWIFWPKILHTKSA